MVGVWELSSDSLPISPPQPSCPPISSGGFQQAWTLLCLRCVTWELLQQCEGCSKGCSQSQWSQQVPCSSFRWVWIRLFLLSCPNIPALVWCKSYSDNTEGTTLVWLQNTGKMPLKSSLISFESRKWPIAFAEVLFSSSECAQGHQRFVICAEWRQCKLWQRFWAVVDTALSCTAWTLCEAVASKMVYSVLWQGDLLLCACSFCQNESIKCGTPSLAHPFVNNP